MSMELEYAGDRRLVTPLGEVVELDGPTDQLAQALDGIKALEGELKDVKSTIGRELLARMDREARWTAHVGRFTLSAPSPEPKVEIADPKALHDALVNIALQGDVALTAVRDAFEVVEVVKPKRAALNRLRKLGGRVAAVIDGAEVPVEKPRYVSVKPA